MANPENPDERDTGHIYFPTSLSKVRDYPRTTACQWENQRVSDLNTTPQSGSNVAEKVVTTDALLTQRTFCKEVSNIRQTSRCLSKKITETDV